MPRAAHADVRIEVPHVSSPGRAQRATRAKYLAMQVALLGVLPNAAPGNPIAEANAALQAPLFGHIPLASHHAERAFKAASCDLVRAAQIAPRRALPANRFKRPPGG